MNDNNDDDTHSSPNLSPNSLYLALDCDNYGRYSAQPIESIEPNRNHRPTFGDDEATDGGEFVSVADEKANCGCEHEYDPLQQRQSAAAQSGEHRCCNDIGLLATMMALTGAFALAELIVGFINNSLTLVADSFHMFSDSAALIVAVIAIRLAARPESDDNAHTFGWKRAEIIGALINGVYLASVCMYIAVEAFFRLLQPVEMQNPWQVFGVGVAGLVINGIGVALFFSHRSLATHGHHGHAHSHGHSHNHSHDDENHNNGKTNNVNLHGVFLHIAGDAVGSLIVVATSLINVYVPYAWRVYFDPCCSIVFALIILRSALPLIRHSIAILMQSVPQHISLTALRQSLLQVAGVANVHELHVWQMASQYNIATVHLVLTNNDSPPSSSVVTSCNKVFCDAGIHRTTIQIE